MTNWRERERDEGKLVTPLYFVVRVEDNQRANLAQGSTEARNSNKAENRLRKLHKSRLGTI